MNTFYTDVIEASPLFNSTKRIDDTSLLMPDVFQKVQQIVADAKSHGIDFMIFETYRSQARQEQLFQQGATKLKTVGVHHYGLACDLVKSANGEPTWKGDYSLLGVLAKSQRLIWGGDWGSPGVHHSFVDVVHVQWCSLARQPSLFQGTWYPAAGYDPYKD